jgi:nitrogen regulatory protein PII
MKPIKKVEIIIDALEMNQVLNILDEEGVSGYSILRNVTGKGGRGLRSDDELTGVFKNSYVLTACDEESMHRVIERIRPLLRRYGGICLVSDAGMVEH